MIWDLAIQTIFSKAGRFIDRSLDPGRPCKWLPGCHNHCRDDWFVILAGLVLFSSFDNLTYVLSSFLSFPTAVFGRAELFQKLLNV